MIKNSKISTKLLLLAVLGIFGVGAVTLLGLLNLRQTMEAERHRAVQQVVETAVSVAAYYHKQAQDGALSAEEAKSRAAAVIRAYRYAQGDYLFVYNTAGVTEIHGTRKDLEGKQRLEEKDATGFAFIRHQIENAKKGGGFTTYRFTKPGGGEVLFEKVSYETLFAPWDWVIASGVYVDDIDIAFRAVAVRAALVLAVLLAVMIGASLLLSRVISTPIRRMAGAPQAPHRGRCRRAGAGGQPAAQSVRADAGHDEEDERRWPDEDDEAHGRPQGHARHGPLRGRRHLPRTRRIDTPNHPGIVVHSPCVHCLNLPTLVCWLPCWRCWCFWWCCSGSGADAQPAARKQAAGQARSAGSKSGGHGGRLAAPGNPHVVGMPERRAMAVLRDALPDCT